MGRFVPVAPRVALWQKRDGTIYRETEGGWEYLSPLFGEWLSVLGQDAKDLKPYPRNLTVPTEILETV